MRLKILWKMLHLHHRSKCSIFPNFFKYMIFQRRQKMLLWSIWLNLFPLFTTTAICSLICLCTLVAYFANNKNPDQTAILGQSDQDSVFVYFHDRKIGVHLNICSRGNKQTQFLDKKYNRRRVRLIFVCLI